MKKLIQFILDCIALAFIVALIVLFLAYSIQVLGFIVLAFLAVPIILFLIYFLRQ